MLRAAGISAGDEVIVPSFGNPEMTKAVLLAGAQPVFADIQAVTYCLDPASVEAAITPRTAGVIAVHRFGRPADLPSLHRLGERHGLLVLERSEQELEDTGLHERRAHAAYLDRKLTGVLTPAPASGHTYEQYVVRVPGNGRPDRDAFARALKARGIGCHVPVKTPVHRMPEFRQDIQLPHTQRAADETLALPVHAGLGRRDLHRIVSACKSLGGLLAPA